MSKQRGSADSEIKPTERKDEEEGYNYKSRSSVTQMTFFIPIIKCCFEWIL